MFRCLNCAQRYDHRAFGSSRKLGGAAEHLIDGSEKRICQLSLEFLSPHVFERRSKLISLLSALFYISTNYVTDSERLVHHLAWKNHRRVTNESLLQQNQLTDLTY